MRSSHTNTAVAAFVMLLLSAPVCHAESAAVRNCTWCHGASAQGYTPAPQLAGQHASYLEQQLVSFANHTRDGPFSKQYMWGAAASLGPHAIHDLATYFSRLPHRAANDGDRDLAAKGESIYQRGMPEANVAACVACHGPNAEGVGQIPRLSGLAYSYLKRRLEQWVYGYHGALAAPMPHIATQLSQEQIEQLASYLSFVK